MTVPARVRSPRIAVGMNRTGEGKTAVVSHDTSCCFGGGPGLGFSDQYESFPGADECSWGFLSCGNADRSLSRRRHELPGRGRFYSQKSRGIKHRDSLTANQRGSIDRGIFSDPRKEQTMAQTRRRLFFLPLLLLASLPSSSAADPMVDLHALPGFMGVIISCCAAVGRR